MNEPVGYKRPPKITQFKVGQSGNPHGRPKGSRNFVTEFLQELAASTTILESGRRTTVTKQTALLRNLIDAAIDGNMRAATVVMAMAARLTTDEHDRPALTTKEIEILDALERDRPKPALTPPQPKSTESPNS